MQVTRFPAVPRPPALPARRDASEVIVDFVNTHLRGLPRRLPRLPPPAARLPLSSASGPGVSTARGPDSARHMRVTNILHSAAVAAAMAAPPRAAASANDDDDWEGSCVENSPTASPESVPDIEWSELVPALTERGFPRLGGLGVVFVARWAARGGRLVAVKVLRATLLGESKPTAESIDAFVREARGLVRVSGSGANGHVSEVLGICRGAAEGWRGARRAARAIAAHFERRKLAVQLAAIGARVAAAAAGGDADGSGSTAADGPDSSGDEADIGAGSDALAASAVDDNDDEADDDEGGTRADPAPELAAIVMSLETGGSLRDSLFSRRAGRLRWPVAMPDRLRVLAETAAGLQCLHSAGLVHGGLGLASVLLASAELPRARLADYGLTSLREGQACTAERARGGGGDDDTAAVPPSRAEDVFAFGRLAWEILCSRPAPRGAKLPSAAELPPEVSAGMCTAVARCLAAESAERPRAAELLATIERELGVLQDARFNVFLSFAQGDDGARRPLADEVFVALRTSGLSVWVDDDGGGDKGGGDGGGGGVASEGIALSDFVVVLASPDYAASEACMLELRKAADGGKPVFACCVEPGPWTRWAAVGDAVVDELARLARLDSHPFADLGAASLVDWAGEATVSVAERHTLWARGALPRLLRHVAAARSAAGARASTESAAQAPTSVEEPQHGRLSALHIERSSSEEVAASAIEAGPPAARQLSTASDRSAAASVVEVPEATPSASPVALHEQLARLRRTLGSEHPDTLACIGDLGSQLQAQGDLVAAEPLLREALEGERAALGGADELVLLGAENLALVLQAIGRAGEAEHFLEAARRARSSSAPSRE